MYSLIFTNKRGVSVDLMNIKDSQVLSVSGLEITQAEVTESKSPKSDGVTFSSIQRGKRNIIINLSQTGLNTIKTRQYLYSIMGGKKKGELRYLDVEQGLDIVTTAIVENITPTQWTTAPVLSISILCESAFFYSRETKKTNISLITPLLEFPLELNAQGQEFGQIKNVNNLRIENNGHETTPCLITLNITGHVINPVISNNTTGEYFSLIGSFSQGQVIKINSEIGKKSIKLVDVDGAERNLFNLMSASSSWLFLEVGSNIFVVSATSGIDNMDIDIAYREIFFGVD